MRVITKIEKTMPALPKLKNVAAYARVSSGKDEMIHSLSNQISSYSKMIQSHPGWKYCGVYADKAMTGTKDERPEFQRLLSDCLAGKIDMIITKSISRFARNTLTILEAVRELKLIGVDVYFEREKIHSMSPDGELMLTLLASFAQEKSRSVSENCKWRIRNRFKLGEPANLRFMFGYTISHNSIQMDSEKAIIVRKIFDDYINGIGCTEIARNLRALGVKNIRGGIWSADRVRNLLHNEKYCGNALLQKKFVIDHVNKAEIRNQGQLPMYFAKGSHEPIISENVFKTAQEIIKKNRIKTNVKGDCHAKYPFTGKIKCALCGKNYKRKICGGKVYWNCATYLKYGKNACFTRQIPEDILMQISAIVLETREFEEEKFTSQIKCINVVKLGFVTFIFHDGREIIKEWEYKSRSESWDEEKRQKAREQYFENLERKKSNG